MKIIRLKGGLGNQMFQYAFAMIWKKRTNEEVLLDFSSFGLLQGDKVRIPRIEKFKISLPKAQSDEVKRFSRFAYIGNSQSLTYKALTFIESKINNKYFMEPNRAYINPDILAGYSFYDGYWQSYKYVDEVKDILTQEFKPNYSLSKQATDWIETVKSENSVLVGIRKGDYAANKKERAHYGSFGEKYYIKAMEYIENIIDNPVYYIFSNDITWCKENINFGSREIHFRDEELQTDDFEELIIMSSCKHAIIINSTYHWWGAELINNPNKVVVCPKKWFFDDKPINIVRPEWIRIKEED